MEKSKLKYLALIFSSVMAIILYIYLLKNWDNIIIYTIGYFFLFGITLFLPDSKYLNWFKVIVLLPGAIISFIGPLSKVVSTYIYAYLMPLAAMALFFKFVPKYVFDLDLSYSSNAYLTLTFSSIFSTLFCEKLIIVTNRIINNNNPSELVSHYQNLALQLVNRQRTRFFVFLSFLVYIFIYSLASLNKVEIFSMENMNSAIMQSFGTYVAFDRLISNKNLFVFNPKEFLSKLSSIWNFDFVNRK